MVDNFLAGAEPNHRTRVPKIKIEFSDSIGAKYSFSVDGLSKDNMIKLIEFVQSISQGNVLDNTLGQGQTKAQQIIKTTPAETNNDTNFAKVYLLIETKFRFGSFTSGDIREAYFDEHGFPLSLPTVSTYLSRLAEKGLLTRVRNGVGWVYRLSKRKQENPSIELTTSKISEPQVSVAIAVPETNSV